MITISFSTRCARAPRHARELNRTAHRRDGCRAQTLRRAQILLTSFVFFVIEMVCLCIARREYRGSFFFCMDMLGTVSILLDVTMFARMVNNWSADGVNDGSVLRAARVAKIGAKSGRLAKLVRLFRLLFSKDDNGVRRVRLRPARPAARNAPARSHPLCAAQAKDLPQAFMVSVQLSKLLAQRVAALVMIIIVAMPLLTFTPDDLSPESFVEIFNLFAKARASAR